MAKALDRKTVLELRGIAQRCGVERFSRMKKADLTKAILLSKCPLETPIVQQKTPHLVIVSKDLPLYQPHRWRTALYRALQSNQISLNACDVRGTFVANSTRVLTAQQKGSASSTIVVLGLLFEIPGASKNREVVAKVSFKYVGVVPDNSLVLEQRIYRFVTMPMIMQGITPHTMLYVGTFSCNDFIRKLERQRGGVPDALLGELHCMQQSPFGEEYDFNRMSMLMLERGRGSSLQDWMINGARSWPEWQAVLFQIVYTLACFGEAGLMQNDLHDGNVWIDRIEPQPFTYLSDVRHEYVHQMNTRWFCKIYDFDLATKWRTPYNTWVMKNRRLSEHGICDTAGVCNRGNPKYDLFRIMYIIHSELNAGIWKERKVQIEEKCPAEIPQDEKKYDHFKVKTVPRVQKQVAEFIESIISPTLLAEQFSHYGSLCRPIVNSRNCRPFIPSSIGDEFMLTPHQVLSTKFTGYRRSIVGMSSMQLKNAVDSRLYHLYSVPLSWNNNNANKPSTR